MAVDDVRLLFFDVGSGLQWEGCAGSRIYNPSFATRHKVIVELLVGRRLGVLVGLQDVFKVRFAKVSASRAGGHQGKVGRECVLICLGEKVADLGRRLDLVQQRRDGGGHLPRIGPIQRIGLRIMRLFWLTDNFENILSVGGGGR